VILLIAPPVAKTSEAPAGIAALAGSLRQHGVGCTVLDANLEGLLFLLDQATGAHSSQDSPDRWATRALRHRAANLEALRSPELYHNIDRYQRAVRDINHLLTLATRSLPEISLNLSNYQNDTLNPLHSPDLLKAAEKVNGNPFFPWFCQRLPTVLAEANPRFVGISLTYISQALCTFALLGFLRTQFPHLKLILGGGLLTSWMRQAEWNNPFAGLVDHCVAGPGEQALLDLLDTPPARSGLQTRPYAEPAPDYTGLPLADYLAPGPILPYAASRGCLWQQCAFCPETAEQSRYLPLPPVTVLAHLSQLRETMRPTLLHLLDNAISPALLRALAEHPPAMSWYGFVRVHEQLADVDFCRQLRNAGCVLLKLGLESGSQAVLDAMHKGIRLEMVERVLAALRQAGIATYVYLLFGTPSESFFEARQTLDFTLRHQEAISFLNLAIFNMPKASSEADLLPGQGFSEGDLSLYQNFVHPRGWDRRAVRTFLDHEFKRHPAIGRIMRRDPPFFTSNHAAFFAR
jgi:hypothetical protein